MKFMKIFPLKLGYASTIHKIQGGTVAIPNTLTSKFEEIFGGSQAYTVLSRVKELDQLFLLDDLFEDKIYTARKSLLALKELEERAIIDNYIGKLLCREVAGTSVSYIKFIFVSPWVFGSVRPSGKNLISL